VSRGLVDTSVFIAHDTGRRLARAEVPDELAVSIITVGELRAGVLAAADLTSRDRRLATLMVALALDPVPVDDAVAQAWAGLRVALRDAGRRLGVKDSWIAATAIALGLPIVTQDVDYTAVPSLRVVTI